MKNKLETVINLIVIATGTEGKICPEEWSDFLDLYYEVRKELELADWKKVYGVNAQMVQDKYYEKLNHAQQLAHQKDIEADEINSFATQTRKRVETVKSLGFESYEGFLTKIERETKERELTETELLRLYSMYCFVIYMGDVFSHVCLGDAGESGRLEDTDAVTLHVGWDMLNRRSVKFENSTKVTINMGDLRCAEWFGAFRDEYLKLRGYKEVPTRMETLEEEYARMTPLILAGIDEVPSETPTFTSSEISIEENTPTVRTTPEEQYTAERLRVREMIRTKALSWGITPKEPQERYDYVATMPLDGKGPGTTARISPPQEDKPSGSAFSGRGGPFKAETFKRLREFRDTNGVGSYRKIAEAADGEISVNEIREMHDAVKYPIGKWQALSRALDTLEENNK